jgi:membrane-associated phospholipid phosphatase
LVIAGFLGLDRWFYEHVSLRLETPTVGDRDFYAVTWPLWWFVRGAFSGLIGVVVIGVVILVLQPTRWRLTTAALAAVLLTALLANAAQAAIGRVRPNQAPSHLTFVRPFSQLWTKQEVCFPSGEAATAFALACALTSLYPRGRVVFYAAGTLAAVSRLVNGAHYISDVAAGALLGVLLANALLRLGKRFAALSPGPHPPLSIP